MEIHRLLVLLPVVIIGLNFLVISTSACSCMPAHPQTQYCNADFVVVARILKRVHRRYNGQFIYKIDIKKTYKMSEKSERLLKFGRIMTPTSESMCGVNFKIGQLYLISGRDHNVNICNFIKEYHKMTIVEKRGVAGGYAYGCNCEIQPCYNSLGCDRPIGGCSWVPWWKCESDFGVCIPTRGLKLENGKPEKCHWRWSESYKMCRQDP